MKIERTIINLNSLSVEDLTTVIDEARKIRARKQKAISLMNRMNELLNEAKAENFDFIDKDFGHVLTDHDFAIYDNQ